MAMIQCEDCGEWISSKANGCPHCGCPVRHDYYYESYETESGRIQARQDAASKIQEKNRRFYRQWRKTYIALSIVMIYFMYLIGEEICSKNFLMACVGLFIVYAILVLLSGVSFWQSLILHLAIPKLFGYIIIVLCCCIGYTIGFIKGMGL